MKGSFEIDSTFIAGNYFIKASTKWMMNFTEDDSYVQAFEVIDAQWAENSTPRSLDYEVHLLPEGGHLVDGVPAVVGVKAIDENGFGAKFDGIVRDQRGNQITALTTSDLGMGKFNLTPLANNSYTLTARFQNGREIDYLLPNADREGISLMLTNTAGHSKVLFSISTNELSSAKLKNKPFYALIHSDGTAQRLDFDFQESNSKVFSLDRSSLAKGINVLTVFTEEGKPLLERLFYNQDESLSLIHI